MKMRKLMAVAAVSLSLAASSASAGVFFVPGLFTWLGFGGKVATAKAATGLGAKAATGLGAKAVSANQAGLIKKTFVVGSYALTGAVLYQMFNNAGYALPSDSFAQDGIARDVIEMRSKGLPGYKPRLCPDADGNMVAVPENYVQCPYTEGAIRSSRGDAVVEF